MCLHGSCYMFAWWTHGPLQRKAHNLWASDHVAGLLGARRPAAESLQRQSENFDSTPQCLGQPVEPSFFQSNGALLTRSSNLCISVLQCICQVCWNGFNWHRQSTSKVWATQWCVPFNSGPHCIHAFTQPSLYKYKDHNVSLLSRNALFYIRTKTVCTATLPSSTLHRYLQVLLKIGGTRLLTRRRNTCDAIDLCAWWA